MVYKIGKEQKTDSFIFLFDMKEDESKDVSSFSQKILRMN